MIKDFGKVYIDLEKRIKFRKKLQKNIRRSIKISKVSAKSIIKNLKKIESFVKRFGNIS